MSDDAVKLLIIDDDPAQRAWITAILARRGLVPAQAAGGEDAVALAAATAFDLVIMDIQMPGMDGCETLKALRALPGAAGSVPVIASTALRWDSPEAYFGSRGFDGYLGKPYDANRLLAEIERWSPGLQTHPRARLAGLAGADDLSVLFGRLRTHLAEALAHLDEPEGREARAHRVAGIAGTLGFAEVYTHWFALSERGDLDVEPARISARKAIQLIDRDAEKQKQG